MQVSQFGTLSGITCHVHSVVKEVNLDRDYATTAFRILQEALTNILRHSGASRVDITINETADDFVLTILDNGRGITEEEKSGVDSLGVVGMRERAHLIGGELKIEAAASGGTRVVVRLPKKPAPQIQ